MLGEGIFFSSLNVAYNFKKMAYTKADQNIRTTLNLKNFCVGFSNSGRDPQYFIFFKTFMAIFLLEMLLELANIYSKSVDNILEILEFILAYPRLELSRRVFCGYFWNIEYI